MAAWILGTERVQRINTGASLLAAGVYATFALLEAFGAASGIVDLQNAPELIAVLLAVPLAFYALLRSGWSRRLRHPSMTLPQVLYAVGALTLSYPANGSVRGLNLMVLALLPVFGIGVLSPRGIRRLAGLSLASIGTMMGWLVLHRPERFDPKLELVHFVLAAAAIPAVAQVAAVVSGLRREQRRQGRALKVALANLEQLATRDELTGLFNRSHMQALLAQEAQRGMRLGAPLCICLMDLDHFKRVNDQHGHAVGDRVLQRFALRCTAVLRDADELVLARLRSEQLRSDDDGSLPRVSFSAGLALQLPGSDLQATIALADAALYRAKASGRDRVLLAT